MLNQSTAATKVTEREFLWLGEHRALDFLNTEPIVRGERVELLGSFDRLVAWCTAAELLPTAVAEDVLARWGASRGAARTLRTAHRLRAELRFALDLRVRTRRHDAATFDTLNACLRLGGAYTELIAGSGRRYRRRILVALTKPEELLRPVADAAVALLCDVDPGAVRRCDNPECVLTFRDVSKNHARRWCSMALCGNRMKVAAHRERQRAKRR
jgi:predicted RNA-binding Zn ribbon-like protein